VRKRRRPSTRCQPNSEPTTKACQGGEGVLRCVGIEGQAPRGAAGEVREVARAGQPDQAVGEDFSIGHPPGIGGDRVVSGVS
jgi:hypothetical protein